MCTGNLCRSPMAEVLLRDELRRRGCAGVDVVSSGTWGMDGSPATPEAVQAVGELDIDLSSHRARSLDVDEVRSADIVVAMTSVHVREITQMVPGADGQGRASQAAADDPRSRATLAERGPDSASQGPAWRQKARTRYEPTMSTTPWACRSAATGER